MSSTNRFSLVPPRRLPPSCNVPHHHHVPFHISVTFVHNPMSITNYISPRSHIYPPPQAHVVLSLRVAYHQSISLLNVCYICPYTSNTPLQSYRSIGGLNIPLTPIFRSSARNPLVPPSMPASIPNKGRKSNAGIAQNGTAHETLSFGSLTAYVTYVGVCRDFNRCGENHGAGLSGYTMQYSQSYRRENE